MFYPAHIKKDGNTWLVQFSDIPEALTNGDTVEEALQNASDALLTAMEFYFEDERAIPMPSPITEGTKAIALPYTVWAKVLLLNSMLSEGVAPSELARRMSCRKQEVTRIMSIRYPTKIETIAQAINATGHRLELAIV